MTRILCARTLSKSKLYMVTQKLLEGFCYLVSKSVDTWRRELVNILFENWGTMPSWTVITLLELWLGPRSYWVIYCHKVDVCPRCPSSSTSNYNIKTIRSWQYLVATHTHYPLQVKQILTLVSSSSSSRSIWQRHCQQYGKLTFFNVQCYEWHQNTCTNLKKEQKNHTRRTQTEIPDSVTLTEDIIINQLHTKTMDKRHCLLGLFTYQLLMIST